MFARRATGNIVTTAREYGPDAPPIYMHRVMEGLTVGLLLKQFSGRINSASEYAWKKLHPVTPVPGLSRPPEWGPNCHRFEVILPDAASDFLWDPRWIVEHYEQAELPGQNSLLLAVKITMRGDGTLHAFWERVRRFAHAELVQRRRLGVILALHVPCLSAAKSPGRPHVHLLAPVRTLGRLGFGSIGDVEGAAVRNSVAEAWIAAAH